jgi:hypothetical protein
MEDKVKCPECGIENPKSRATCQVCHHPLRKPASKDASASEKKEAKAEKPETKTTAKNPFDDKKEPTIKEAAIKAGKKVIKRRARRKSRKPTNEQYFILGSAGLIPVEISIKVKKAEAKGDASKLIEFYKHNKDLISG